MNLTTKLIVPILHTFGKAFTNKINTCKIKGYYIDDLKLRKATRETQEYIFIELEPNKNIEKDLAWFRKHERYVRDYPYDYEATSHVLVFDISDYKTAVTNFLKGEYSKMYSEEEIKEFNLSPSKVINRARFGIWSKSNDYKRVFVERLNEEFNTQFNPEDLKLDELELPINSNDEFL